MSVSWLNKDVGNIIKEFSDPLTYFRLLRVSRVFQPTNQERYLRKLREYYYTLIISQSDMRMTRSMKKKRRLIYNKINLLF